MIRVREYWPDFVDRDESPQEALVEQESDILHIPWIDAKRPDDIKWYSDGTGLVSSDHWVIATLKRL